MRQQPIKEQKKKKKKKKEEETGDIVPFFFYLFIYLFHCHLRANIKKTTNNIENDVVFHLRHILRPYHLALLLLAI